MCVESAAEYAVLKLRRETVYIHGYESGNFKLLIFFPQDERKPQKRPDGIFLTILAGCM